MKVTAPASTGDYGSVDDRDGDNGVGELQPKDLASIRLNVAGPRSQPWVDGADSCLREAWSAPHGTIRPKWFTLGLWQRASSSISKHALSNDRNQCCEENLT
jgi:hypothetical protein